MEILIPKSSSSCLTSLITTPDRSAYPNYGHMMRRLTFATRCLAWTIENTDMDHQGGCQQGRDKLHFLMDPTIVVAKILRNLPTLLANLRRSTLGVPEFATSKRRPCYATHLRCDPMSSRALKGSQYQASLTFASTRLGCLISPLGQCIPAVQLCFTTCTTKYSVGCVGTWKAQR